MKIGLLSDTHSYLDPKIFTVFARCDEIWHAGDIGNIKVLEELQEFKVVRAVYGNIDDAVVRVETREWLDFTVEGMHILMTHIGGYPGRYARGVRSILEEKSPDLFICGHSHILKVIYDKQLSLLHMNPGAAGKHGMHRIRTALRFDLLDGKVKNPEIIELGLRGSLSN